MRTAVLIAVVVVAFAATANARLLAPDALEEHARQLFATSEHLLGSCSLSAAGNCQQARVRCVTGLTSRTRHGLCDCFQQLGTCLHSAGCLNGTNEDLHTQFCMTGDSYCCNAHGDFQGCGVQDGFTGTQMCMCEDGYSGTMCNTTSTTVCSSDPTKCTSCSTCCKDYSHDTCEACTVDECDDAPVCTNDMSACTACDSCCKSYLIGDQVDCAICVEHECNN